MTKQNVGKNVKKLQPAYITNGRAKWYSNLQNSYQAKYTLRLWPNNFNFKYYLPKINEKCLRKDSCKIFHNNAILTTPNWKKKTNFYQQKNDF